MTKKILIGQPLTSFLTKTRIKTNPLEKCGKPDFFGAERSEARKKAAQKKFSQGAEVFLLYFLMNPSVFLK